MALWEKMEGQPGTILGWLTFFESQSEEGRPKKNDNALTSLDIQWGYCALSQASQENAQSTSMYKWCSLQEWVDQGQPCLIASLPGWSTKERHPILLGQATVYVKQPL
jgi:hypothetical protein